MRAMVLAAGLGVRMRPFSDSTPKALALVNAKPLIAYHLENLASIGIAEVVINLHHLADKIKHALGDGTQYGVKIYYSYEQELLNTGGGIKHALPLLGEQPFIVISADIYSDFPLKALQTLRLPDDALANLVMVANPNYHPAGDFAFADFPKGKLLLAGGKKYTYANIGIFRPEFFSHAPTGAFPLSSCLRQHIANNKVLGHYYNGVWYNVGTIADLQRLTAKEGYS